jgi:hypothetical protein
VFVPYSPHILSYALKHWQKGASAPGRPDDWFFFDHIYTQLG